MALVGSPPTREAWIEITKSATVGLQNLSPPTREAWIEMFALASADLAAVKSPPTREAWIEIHLSVRR